LACEVAAVMTDLAEFLGTVAALSLLLPLPVILLLIFAKNKKRMGQFVN
jgi:Mn2+/Fe2+ NRAMP family transporter